MKKRKILNLVILALFIGVLSSGCTSGASSASSWPGVTVSEEAGYFAYSNQVYALDIKNGSLLWSYPQEASTSRQFYAAPSVGSDLVVVGDYTNTLAGIDKQSGFEKWQFTAAEDRYIGSALVLDGYVYAPNTDHYLYALDENGDLIWRFKASGPNWTKPLADESYLYMVSMDHFLYALNFEYEGSNLEAGEDGSRTVVAEPVWSLDLGAAVVGDPVMVDGVLYTGTIDGTLYAVDLENQTILWSFKDDNNLASIWGSPVIVSDTIYIGDEDGNVYAVSVLDGTALWPSPFAAGSSVISSGVDVNDLVVFATSAGKIFTINENKEPKTLTTLDAALYASLKYAGEMIVVAPNSSDGLFMAIDSSGNETWNYLPND